MTALPAVKFWGYAVVIDAVVVCNRGSCSLDLWIVVRAPPLSFSQPDGKVRNKCNNNKDPHRRRDSQLHRKGAPRRRGLLCWSGEDLG